MSCQFNVRMGRTRRSIDLSIGINDVTDIIEEIGQVLFGAFAPPRAERVHAFNTGGEIVHSFADGPTVPTEFSLCKSLPTGSELSNSLGRELATRTALEFGCSALEQKLNALCKIRSQATLGR